VNRRKKTLEVGTEPRNRESENRKKRSYCSNFVRGEEPRDATITRKQSITLRREEEELRGRRSAESTRKSVRVEKLPGLRNVEASYLACDKTIYMIYIFTYIYYTYV